MVLERTSPCKINLILNILSRRGDGFHELETVMHPVPLCDHLAFEKVNQSEIQLTCNHPLLPCDQQNLVWRAADLFFRTAALQPCVRIHLHKTVPLAAGLGGGSSNAAHTLIGLNDLFGLPLSADLLRKLAESLGSDVPFFLESGPALATGRGEQVTRIAPLPALKGAFVFMVHPGFGVPTAWAYRTLSEFPEALQGRRGRAQTLLEKLRKDSLEAASSEFYNSLEIPVLRKYPLLDIFLRFFKEEGAIVSLMSGSGSTTFAMTDSQSSAETLRNRFHSKFGNNYWTQSVKLVDS